MREHISRDKKTTTGFSNPSLKHPVRGFGLDSPQTAPRVVPDLQRLKTPSFDLSHIKFGPQAKLTVNKPGDIFEQEADRVAQQVMGKLGQPGNSPGIQREQMPEEEEELQMKPLTSHITPLVQRQEMPEEEELQMKPLDITTLQRQEAPEEEEELQMSPMVQRQAGAEMATAPDLETSINQARGGGQPMADNIRKPMEQAFGADFSGVKVHTDGQSDQLNRSIQARAFTTGQDVFFGQGEYNPGSRGGQELLAHELTHVVQQSGGAVHKKSMMTSQAEVKSKQFAYSCHKESGVLQRAKTPKALKYRSYTGKRRQEGIKKMKRTQVNLRRGRQLHVRHIIPHSDLQQWMLIARQTGNQHSIPGQMRRQIEALLLHFGDAANAQLWNNAYIAYENQNTNQSLLQQNSAVVNAIWQAIEWHQGNLFLGQSGINVAIQNRFDAGIGAVGRWGNNYINGLHRIWHSANTLLGLAPTPIQDMRIYSVWLQAYIIVRCAEHNNSRAILPVRGLIHRSDYVRLG